MHKLGRNAALAFRPVFGIINDSHSSINYLAVRKRFFSKLRNIPNLQQEVSKKNETIENSVKDELKNKEISDSTKVISDEQTYSTKISTLDKKDSVKENHKDIATANSTIKDVPIYTANSKPVDSASSVSEGDNSLPNNANNNDSNSNKSNPPSNNSNSSDKDAKLVSNSKPQESSNEIDLEATLLNSEVPRPHKVMSLVVNARPVFPGAAGTIVLSNIEILKEIQNNLSQNSPYLGLFLKLPSDPIDSVEKTDTNVSDSDDKFFTPSYLPGPPNDRYAVGALVQVQQIITDPEANRVQLIYHAHRRITALHTVSKGPAPWVSVHHWSNSEELDDSLTVRAYVLECVANMKEIIQISPLLKEQAAQLSMALDRVDMDNGARIADFAAMLVYINAEATQAILEEKNTVKRLSLAIDMLKKEIEFNKLQRRVNKSVEDRIAKHQKDFLLMQQLKAIKKELGVSKDTSSQFIERCAKNLIGKTLNTSVFTRLKEEFGKLERLEGSTSEYSAQQTYLEWITSMPWGVLSPETFDLKKAYKVLETDHFALHNVKQRILEYLAVSAARRSKFEYDRTQLLNPGGAIYTDNEVKEQLKNVTQEVIKKVKELENSWKVNGGKGNIINLVGPPGVGKTSICKSIARSLNRKYYRISVGGFSDVSELKGHRRTYVAAMPGQIAKALKSTNCENPIIIIDEIDKMWGSMRGNPASALLEVLDPSQNMNFMDYYIDIPLDLSRVLFITTANSLEGISGPLRDRMETIFVSGYDHVEKVAIAQRYLIPSITESFGISLPTCPPPKLTDNELETEKLIDLESSNDNKDPIQQVLQLSEDESIYFSSLKSVLESLGTEVPNDIVEPKTIQPTEVALTMCKPSINVDIRTSALDTLIKGYCREAGVRQLRKLLEKIIRKVVSKDIGEQQKLDFDFKDPSVKIKTPSDFIETNIPIENKPESETTKSFGALIDASNLENYIGKPYFTKDRMYELETPPGIVMGLAYTNYGGEALYIESIQLDSHSKGGLQLTGQLGDVMKESSQIAFSFVKGFALKNNLSKAAKFLQDSAIHVHIPEGATPKDGPSAGITMTTALLSLALNEPVRPIAMTGELSLTGQVLPIGGLREKVTAARRVGIRELVVPSMNRREISELESHLKEGLTVHYASHYDDVFKHCFKSLNDKKVDENIFYT